MTRHGEYALIAGVIFLAACLQASSGFGMGMLAAPVIAMVDPALLPATLILLALLVTVMVTVRERQSLDLRGTGWALVGRIPGSFLGAWLVTALSREGLAWVVVAVVLTGLVLAVRGWAPRPVRVNLIAAGAASGIMGTATSIGGPPMALVWQGHDGPRLRGTMSAFFMVGSSISMVMLWITGAVTAEMLALALWMVPAAVGGYVASRFVNRFLNAARLKALALGASALGSVLLMVQLVLAAIQGPEPAAGRHAAPEPAGHHVHEFPAAGQPPDVGGDVRRPAFKGDARMAGMVRGQHGVLQGCERQFRRAEPRRPQGIPTRRRARLRRCAVPVRAANSAAWSTTGPRATLIRNAEGFMAASSAAPIIPSVAESSGTVTTTTSDAARSAVELVVSAHPVQADSRPEAGPQGCAAQRGPSCPAPGHARHLGADGAQAHQSQRQVGQDGMERHVAAVAMVRHCPAADSPVGRRDIAGQHQRDHQDVLGDGPCVVERVGHQRLPAARCGNEILS